VETPAIFAPFLDGGDINVFGGNRNFDEN